MKITIEHINPYLPYGLKVIFNDDRKGDLISTLRVISIEENQIQYQCTNDQIDERYMSWDSADGKFKMEGIPVLRPLSDLLDEGKDLWIDFSEEIGEINTLHLRKSIVNKIYYAMDIRKFPIIQKWLFKNHFDVFDLIKQGLAIDINTIK